MDLPELNTTASDAAESVENHARNLVPWLPTPMTCPDCAVLCEADVVYDSGMCEWTEAWVCPNEGCGNQFYREEPWHE